MERAAEIASGGATFRDVARSWLAKEKPGWSKIHYDKSKRAIERDVLPALGKLPVRDITPAMVAGVIEAIQRRGVRDTAAKVFQLVRSIFRYAAAKGYRADNPADPVVEVRERPGTRLAPKPIWSTAPGEPATTTRKAASSPRSTTMP